MNSNRPATIRETVFKPKYIEEGARIAIPYT